MREIIPKERCLFIWKDQQTNQRRRKVARKVARAKTQSNKFTLRALCIILYSNSTGEDKVLMGHEAKGIVRGQVI